MRFILITISSIIISGFSFAKTSQSDYDVFVQKCSTCHGLELIEKKKKTKDEWKNTLKRMQRYGAKYDGKENQILNYLINKK
ncbi:MAG: hypothetical protein N3C60_06615 [Calditerrivibrio sp.]|nr:hypothetical protein [Calditerrivibrio sp.]